ncbi:hypothetical protein ACSBR2_000677 [Camellia fascicularis]
MTSASTVITEAIELSNHTQLPSTLNPLASIKPSMTITNPRHSKKPPDKLRMSGGKMQTESEEMEDQVMNPIQHKISQHRVMLFLEPKKEASHLVAAEWWIEEVKLKIKAWWQFEASQSQHLVITSSKLSMEDNHNRVREMLGTPEQSPIPNLPHMYLMDMLFWNCRGAGNNKFKRNIKELIKIHKPDILVLMETKVEFQSMGMFFNTLGFTTSAHVDPIGRSRGIWMLCNPNNVNVRISKPNS